VAIHCCRFAFVEPLDAGLRLWGLHIRLRGHAWQILCEAVGNMMPTCARTAAHAPKLGSRCSPNVPDGRSDGLGLQTPIRASIDKGRIGASSKT
jgi:hypothetical protein